MVNLFDKSGRSLYFSNRREYYRRLNISITAQERRLNIQALEEFEAPITFKKKRIRKQVTFNSRYSISLRAIMINGETTLKQLEDLLNEFLFNEPSLSTIPFDSTGLEEEEIDDFEDRGIPDGEILIELNIRGNVTIINA